MKTKGNLCPAWALALPVALALGSVRAQSYDVLVSLTADDALAAEAVRDQDLVRHAPGAGAYVQWPSETLSLLAGDGGGSQALHLVFTDIDAIDDGGALPAGDGLRFSIANDQAGFKDGDVLAFDASGVVVFLAEAKLIEVTGASDGNVDLDALQIDPGGTILFSFADNENSSLLSGDVANQIKDGDVLSWMPGLPSAIIVYTEKQIDTMVTHALGATSTTTDTSSLARDPNTGDLLFTVLSPTANDASVFTEANGGTLVAGHAEADFGFTGAPEIDALSVAASSFPALTTSSGNPGAGAQLTFTLRGAQPNAPHVILSSLGMHAGGLPLNGWGRFVLNDDLLLGLTWSTASFYIAMPNGAGTGSLLSVVPPALPAVDVVLQAVRPGAGAQASNPLVLELLQ